MKSRSRGVDAYTASKSRGFLQIKLRDAANLAEGRAARRGAINRISIAMERNSLTSLVISILESPIGSF